MRLAAAALAACALAACGGPAAPQPSSPAAPGTATPLSAALAAGEFVDLSHTYDAGTIFWPTAETFALQKVADGDTPAGFYYAANNFSGSEHGGTHIDAPAHFAKGRTGFRSTR